MRCEECHAPIDACRQPACRFGSFVHLPNRTHYCYPGRASSPTARPDLSAAGRALVAADAITDALTARAERRRDVADCPLCGTLLRPGEAEIALAVWGRSWAVRERLDDGRLVDHVVCEACVANLPTLPSVDA